MLSVSRQLVIGCRPHGVLVFGDPFFDDFQYTLSYHSSMMKKPHPRINHQHSVFVCRLNYQIVPR